MMSASLVKSIRYLLFFTLLVVVLYYARPFLIPLSFGALFSMLLLPLSDRLEQYLGKAFSILVCILLLIFIALGIFALIGWQISDIASDASRMQTQVMRMVARAQQQISAVIGISPEEQRELLQNQQEGSSAGGTQLTSVFGALMSVAANSLLVLVYIFLFLYTRKRLKIFLLKLTPERHREEATRTIGECRKVAQHYLSGLSMMIVCLWILYGIGFTIAGVKNALFFAILCGLLEIIPFIGNLTGTLITSLMALSQGGGVTILVGVLITYAIVQLFQSYVLEPLVVGSKVNINPLFTIVILIAGELLWGIAGMVLAIPLLGIFKIICDHVEPLKPYGYLMGDDGKRNESSGSERRKHFFRRKSDQ